MSRAREFQVSRRVASEAIQLGHAIAKDRRQSARELFGTETLESENARRIVARRLRAAHPRLSFEAVMGIVEEGLGT